MKIFYEHKKLSFHESKQFYCLSGLSKFGLTHNNEEMSDPVDESDAYV